jgi:hypothetical protein
MVPLTFVRSLLYTHALCGQNLNKYLQLCFQLDIYRYFGGKASLLLKGDGAITVLRNIAKYMSDYNASYSKTVNFIVEHCKNLSSQISIIKT